MDESNPVNRLRKIARPVIFKTGVPDYPVSVAGTCFIVGFRGKHYVLTAKHVVRDYPVEHLLILPAEGAKRAFRVPQSWRVENFEGEPEGDPDSSDLLIMRVTLDGLKRLEKTKGRVLVLDIAGIFDWFDDRFSSNLFMFGYPKSRNGVDYAQATIEANQVLLSGSYVGPSYADHCHEARFSNPLAITDFDGLSGSPVFCVVPAIAKRSVTRFCGIAIRGGASERRVHFLGAEVVLESLIAASSAT